MGYMSYHHRTKAERKEWWRSLTPEEQSTYLDYWVRKRQSPKPFTFSKDTITVYTPKLHKEINDRMKCIGLEKYIIPVNSHA